MQIFSLRNEPACPGVLQVCKYSALTSLVWALVWTSLSVGCFWLADRGGYFDHGWSVPGWLLRYVGGLMALGVLFLLWRFKKGISTQNWLLKICDDGVVVKIRSHLNSHFSLDDEVVVAVPWREIQWCRQTKQSVASPGTEVDSTQIRFYTYLDLKLKTDDLVPLRGAMRAERLHEGPVHRHYPVKLMDTGLLRLDWAEITPRLGKTLKLLAQKTTVEAALRIKFSDLDKLQGTDLEDQILSLAQGGEVIQAIKLVRLKYGKSLDEAKEFVDELAL